MKIRIKFDFWLCIWSGSVETWSTRIWIWLFGALVVAAELSDGCLPWVLRVGSVGWWIALLEFENFGPGKSIGPSFGSFGHLSQSSSSRIGFGSAPNLAKVIGFVFKWIPLAGHGFGFPEWSFGFRVADLWFGLFVSSNRITIAPYVSECLKVDEWSLVAWVFAVLFVLTGQPRLMSFATSLQVAFANLW